MLTELALRLSTSLAPAPDGAPDSEGHAMVMILFYAGLFAIFYFLLIRPQTKRTKDTKTMQSDLNKGDAVVTSGGLFGTVHKIKDDVITLQIADDVRVKFQLSAISSRVRESETKKSDE